MKHWFLSLLALSFLSVPALAQDPAPQNMQCQSSSECVLTKSAPGSTMPECSSIHSQAATQSPWPKSKSAPSGSLKCGCLKSIGACSYGPPGSLK